MPDAPREATVARFGDLQDGQMKQVSVGETDVLLVRLSGVYHAFHAYCTHYGAPLADGALSDERIVCPWHHACFHPATGRQLEPPGLDAIRRYDVRVEGGDVIVSLPEAAGDPVVADMARRDAADERVYVVVGGGAAGMYAVEGLREKGFTGRVIMVSKEPYVPYDRPNCSKDYLQDEAPEAWMFFRDEAFYDERDIERRQGTVVRLDAVEKIITFDDGETLAYDGAILCPGGAPQRLDVPGADLDGVHLLRSFDDSTVLREAGKQAGQAVVVGGGFIGMEAAFSLKKLGVGEVTVVARGAVPFAAQFGERVGRRVMKIHEENGVRFHTGHEVAAFEGEGRLEGVRLDDGTVLEADLALVGIGVHPAADFVEGVVRDTDRGIIVNAHLRAADNLYAAGDVARFPDWRTGERIRVEHWRLACQHGRLAAYNLAGQPTPYLGVPFFWTAHFGTSFRYVGHAQTWDDVVYDGDPDDGDFIAYYVQEGRVLAACGTGRDGDLAAFEELMRRDAVPEPDDLAAGVDLCARLRALGERGNES